MGLPRATSILHRACKGSERWCRPGSRESLLLVADREALLERRIDCLKPSIILGVETPGLDLGVVVARCLHCMDDGSDLGAVDLVGSF